MPSATLRRLLAGGLGASVAVLAGSKVATGAAPPEVEAPRVVPGQVVVGYALISADVAALEPGALPADPAAGRLVRRKRRARAAVALVRVTDGAGNAATERRPLELRLARRQPSR